MRRNHEFSIDQLDAHIMEAERLVEYIEKRPDGQELHEGIKWTDWNK